MQAPGAQGFGGGQTGGSFGGEAFSDIFENLFGGRGRAGGGRGFAIPGDDLETEVDLTLREVLTGVTKRVSLREPLPCSTCQGTGTLRNRTCPTCFGSGSTTEAKTIEVKIPAGLTSGQSIRLKGQGWPSAAGKPGDALITVHVAAHPLFKPDGADLRLDLPITLYEAALGGKVRVPTLDGAVELAIPAATNSGRTFRLKGKGLKSKNGTGDLLATVRIMLPDKTDEQFRELMRKWREAKPYDPRKDLG